MAIFKSLQGQWDRVAAVVLTLAGAVALIVGWIGASGEGLTAKQIPFVLSGGLGGIFMMGLGAALWLSSDLRDEWVKLDRIEHVLATGLEGLGIGRDQTGSVRIAPIVAAAPAESTNGRHSAPAYAAGGTSES